MNKIPIFFYSIPYIYTVLVVLLVFVCPAIGLAAQVTLSWDRGNGENPAGYRAYLHAEGENYDYSNFAWEGTDNKCEIFGLDENITYYFIVRAVDRTGQESGNSNEVSFRAEATQQPSVDPNPDPDSDQTEDNIGYLSDFSILTPSDYAIDKLQLGDRYYLDRNYVLTSVPPVLSTGSEHWVMSRNGDKTNKSAEFLQFAISQPCTVYVAYDPRASSLPNWLRDNFLVTSLSIGVSDRVDYLDVYEAHFSAGTVTLGGNLGRGASGAKSNYIVILQPVASVPEVRHDGVGDDFDGLVDSSNDDRSGDAARSNTVTILTPSDYVVAELEVGDQYFSDRSFTLASIPLELSEGREQWIKTWNNDKYDSSGSFLQFTLTQEASVYVGYDSRADSLPDWLRPPNFTPTGMTIEVDEGPHGPLLLDVYERVYAAGTVVLGGNLARGASGATSNYVVIVGASSTGLFDNEGSDDSDPLVGSAGPDWEGEITLVNDISILTPTDYEVASNLQKGDRYYLDRNYTVSYVPAYLEGATYIKTANNDKVSVGDDFLSFDVNQDVTVYVAHDDLITDKPSWLLDFTDTGDQLVTTDKSLSIYARDFSADTITLGGNSAREASWDSSNYTVIVLVN